MATTTALLFLQLLLYPFIANTIATGMTLSFSAYTPVILNIAVRIATAITFIIPSTIFVFFLLSLLYHCFCSF